jgi:hypothetical protein
MDDVENPGGALPPEAEFERISGSVLPADELDETPFADDAEQVVERQLAHFTFVREGRDREVRLLFRDTPSSEVARAFRAAGAYLITLLAERTSHHEHPQRHSEVETEEGHHAHARRGRHASRPTTEPVGEATMRYFYSLGETVYTVSIVSTTGLVESIAGVYPMAMRLEQEASQRSAVVFRPGVAA